MWMNVTGTSGAIAGPVINNCMLTIGSMSNGPNDFSGQLDCVRVWNTELTDNEIKNLYQSTFGNITGQYDILT